MPNPARNEALEVVAANAALLLRLTRDQESFLEHPNCIHTVRSAAELAARHALRDAVHNLPKGKP